ncbi:MAG: nitroreductase [Clostridia bacterium]|nr:nitroreductase [Clostridia bacterium]
MVGNQIMELLYNYIFKRKSFHLFRNNKTKEYYKDFFHIENNELDNIYKYFNQIKPLISNIKVKIRIVKEEETNCKRGAEYCILFYSEQKQNFLQNIGYIGEQLDLYLVSQNIGTLWFGIGKTDEPTYEDLSFVTMMAICKVPNDSFRKDMYKSKRKSIEEIYEGKNYLDIINIARFSPSSCNTQPWLIKDIDNKTLAIYRYRKRGKRGIMPNDRVIYQNLIDIGIFIYILELILNENDNSYNLKIYDDDTSNKNKYTHVATFELK